MRPRGREYEGVSRSKQIKCIRCIRKRSREDRSVRCCVIWAVALNGRRLGVIVEKSVPAARAALRDELARLGAVPITERARRQLALAS